MLTSVPRILVKEIVKKKNANQEIKYSKTLLKGV